MYKNYVELSVEGLTKGKDLREAYILVLKEKKGEHFFPVLLNADGYDLVSAALNHKDYTCSRLMNKLAMRVGMTMLGVRMMQPQNGNTLALIDYELINEVVSISVPIAEAVVAALETRSSIWIDRNRFERHTKIRHDEQSVALPIAGMTDQLLKDALRSAVETDNFELASILRDELKKRVSNGGNIVTSE